MTSLFIRWFIKNPDMTNDPKVRKSYGTLSGVVGITVNLLLSLLKLVFGLIAGSVAIVADAMNNLSDAGSSVFALISFKIASKPADRDHPFGHARMEYIASMIVSFLILIVGAELFISSFSTLVGISESSPVEVSYATIIVLGASVLAKLWLSLFYKKIAKRISSSVISASSTDSLTDSISTFAVLVCAVVIRFTDWFFLDSVVGMAVAGFILFAGIKILIETKNSLLGEAPVDEVVKQINTVIARHPEALGVHDMMIHNYGPNHYIASLHIEVDGSKNIFDLHDAVDNIEKEIYIDYGIVCTVHMDPIVTDDERVTELRNFTDEIVRSIEPNATIHDFRTVIGKTHTNLMFDIVLPFESKFTPKQIQEAVFTTVMKERPEHYCVITVDRG